MGNDDLLLKVKEQRNILHLFIYLFLLLIPYLLQSVRRHLVNFVSIALETCRRYFQ
jgi:hypothetical protein